MISLVEIMIQLPFLLKVEDLQRSCLVCALLEVILD